MARINKSIEAMKSTRVKRFWSNAEKAIQAAQDLFTQMEQAMPIYVFEVAYGNMGNKEYHVRTWHETDFTKSQFIIHKITPKYPKS